MGVPHPRGAALLSVLATLALLFPVVTHTVVQSHLDLLQARNFRDHTDAMYLAEAGIESALARIPPFGSPHSFAAGRDGGIGTEDDLGQVHVSEGDRHCRTTVHVIDATTADLVSTAQTQHGAQRVVAARLRASPYPYTPATLLHGAGANLRLGPDIIVAGGAPAVDQRTTAVPARLDAAQLHPDFDVASLVVRLYGHALAVPLAALPADLPLGSRDAPQLSVVGADLLITDSVSGAGILLIRGALRLQGTLRFEGLLVVDGDLETSPGSELWLDGALWQIAPEARLQLEGRGRLRHDSMALAGADIAAPEVLPRAIQMYGLREPS